MEHAFNVKLAQDFSVNVALFLHHIKFWIFNNLANKRNIYDGHCWTYNTLDAFKITFPYWSKQTIETTIKHCVDGGLLIKGNYNKNKYDRTCWYALTSDSYQYFDEFLNEELMQPLSSLTSGNHDMYLVESRNLYQILKPDTNKPPIVPQGDEKCFDDFWALYPVHEAKAACVKVWSKEKLDKKAEEIMGKLHQQIREDDKFLKGYAPNPLKYLKEKRWEDEIKPSANYKPAVDKEALLAQQQVFEEAQNKQYM